MTIDKIQMSIAAFLVSTLLWSNTAIAAVDSYRYLHVSVQTPYTIFLFLLMGILAPFVLMGILVWRFVGHTTESEEHPANPPQQKESAE